MEVGYFSRLTRIFDLTVISGVYQFIAAIVVAVVSIGAAEKETCPARIVSFPTSAIGRGKNHATNWKVPSRSKIYRRPRHLTIVPKKPAIQTRNVAMS